MYRRVEKAFFGVFWDMPVQLHAFFDAVEKTHTWEQHEAFAKQLEETVLEARGVVEKPRRSPKGKIEWKRTVPFVSFALADEIESSARIFFTSVYAQCVADRMPLSNHEKAFWKRLDGLRNAFKRARLDREDLYQIFLCLRRWLPNELCTTVLLMLH